MKPWGPLMKLTRPELQRSQPVLDALRQDPGEHGHLGRCEQRGVPCGELTMKHAKFLGYLGISLKYHGITTSMYHMDEYSFFYGI